VKFLHDGEQDFARESGASTKKRARRKHSSAFKSGVALAVLKAIEHFIRRLSNSVHPNQIAAWIDQLAEYAAQLSVWRVS